MKTIFKHLQIELSKVGEQQQKVDLLIIKNADGRPRWISPANAEQAYFLKFYNSNTFKSRVMAIAIQILFALRLQKLFFVFFEKVGEFRERPI